MPHGVKYLLLSTPIFMMYTSTPSAINDSTNDP